MGHESGRVTLKIKKWEEIQSDGANLNIHASSSGLLADKLSSN